MKTQEEIGTQVRKAFKGEPGEFRACAYFDDRLDCIRVIARDCSVLETRLNERLTILEDMYYPEGRRRYVGFTIKGASHFCRENNLKFSAPIRLTTLLDAVLQRFPETPVQIFIDGVARALVEDEKIEQVEIIQAEPMTA
jgi:hypothetical protein